MGVDAEQRAWRSYIEDRITAIERNQVARLDAIGVELQANTEISIETRDALRDFKRRAGPAVEVTEAMIRGAALMGRTADFCNKWGGRVLKLALWGAGLWAAAKVLGTGGGWLEAVRAFNTIKGD